MLISVYIANKNLFSSLMNIRFGMFLIKYKSIYSITKNPKMLDILFVSSICFFWDNYAFEVLYKKFILQMV